MVKRTDSDVEESERAGVAFDCEIEYSSQPVAYYSGLFGSSGTRPRQFAVRVEPICGRFYGPDFLSHSRCYVDGQRLWFVIDKRHEVDSRMHGSPPSIHHIADLWNMSEYVAQMGSHDRELLDYNSLILMFLNQTSSPWSWSRIFPEVALPKLGQLRYLL